MQVCLPANSAIKLLLFKENLTDTGELILVNVLIHALLVGKHSVIKEILNLIGVLIQVNDHMYAVPAVGVFVYDLICQIIGVCIRKKHLLLAIFVESLSNGRQISTFI